MIYVIACSKTNSCKIGYSSSPENRLAQLQTGNPFVLELVTTAEGGIEEERRLHSLFKKYRLSGEWFDYNKEIKDFFKIEDFYLIYPSMITILKSSSDVRMKLFASLLERYGKGQEFSMSKALKIIIAEETDCKPRSFDTAFTYLLKENIIMKWFENDDWKQSPKFKNVTLSKEESKFIKDEVDKAICKVKYEQKLNKNNKIIYEFLKERKFNLNHPDIDKDMKEVFQNFIVTYGYYIIREDLNITYDIIPQEEKDVQENNINILNNIV